MVAFVGIQTQVYKVALTLGDINLQNFYGLAVVALIPAILGNGLPRRILSSAPLVFIGRRSFSLYLVQELAWQAVQHWAPWVGVHGWGGMVATTVVGLLMAEVLYRTVERPMIAFGRRLEHRNGGSPLMVGPQPAK